MTRRLLLAVAIAGLCAAVVFALKDQQWSAVTALTGPSDLALLTGAFALNCLGLFVAMLAWRALLRGLDVRIGLLPAARIYFVGILAKLVPGRVWSLVANLRMGNAIGIPQPRMAAAYVLSIPVTLLTGLAIGLIGAPTALGGQAAWLGLAALALAVLAAKPDLVNRLTVTLTRILRRPAPQTGASASGIRWAIAAQSFSWLIAGVHLWLLAVAAGAPVWRSLPLCLGAFGFAAVLSALIIFLPDGIGAREAMLIAALTTLLPLPAATTVVVLSRLICTLSEVVVAAVTLAAARFAVRRFDRDDDRGDLRQLRRAGDARSVARL